MNEGQGRRQGVCLGGGGANALQLPPPASKVAQVLKKLMSGEVGGFRHIKKKKKIVIMG